MEYFINLLNHLIRIKSYSLKNRTIRKIGVLTIALTLISCSSDSPSSEVVGQPDDSLDPTNILNINFNELLNYSDQFIPEYISKDNLRGNPITNEVATLGRILFYDKNLSTNNTVSCASCHKQELAFGDDASQSVGINGVTSRHSMRLINVRFASENRLFWDERANSLEEQTTVPIQDHIEMGFSGKNGDLSFDDLIDKLENTAYYPGLFDFAFGTPEISEAKIQTALAQFVRSIQSFDSKYDQGRIQVGAEDRDFPNYTAQENLGKSLFIGPPVFDEQGSRTSGGLGCIGCHQAPEFDIAPNSLNNGITSNANGVGADFSNTRSPSLRDVLKASGSSNGPFMHNGRSADLAAVLNHYNNITAAGNPNLDPRLRPNGNGQKLNLIQTEIDAVMAFLKTLGGSAVYRDERWRDPFVN